MLQNISGVAEGDDSGGDQADRRKTRLRIAVLGSSGGMGSLLAKYFISKGHEVVGFDPNKGESIHGLTKERSGQAAVRGANVVVLAPPIDLTLRVLEEVL